MNKLKFGFIIFSTMYLTNSVLAVWPTEPSTINSGDPLRTVWLNQIVETTLEAKARLLNIYADNDNVGIGTTTPGRNLDIESSTGSSTGLTLNNTAAGGQKFSLFSTNTNSGLGGGNFGIYDDTNSAARLLIDSDGDVTIGGDITVGATKDVCIDGGGNCLSEANTGLTTTTQSADGALNTNFNMTWIDTNVEVTLPSAASFTDKFFMLKSIADGGSVITNGTEKLDFIDYDNGSALTMDKNDMIKIFSNGTDWYIIGGNLAIYQ